MIRSALAASGLLIGGAFAHPPAPQAQPACGCLPTCCPQPQPHHPHHCPQAGHHPPDAPPAPAERPSERVAGIEAGVGLATNFLGLVGEGDGLQAIQEDTGPLASLTPFLEWRYGSVLYLGIDTAFASVADFTAPSGRRSVIAPGVRMRLSFDLARDWQADAVFGGGIALWDGEGGPRLLGWSRRMAFGAAWQAKEGLWPFLLLGSQTVEAGPVGKGPLSDEFDSAQPVGAAAFMLTVGVRTGL